MVEPGSAPPERPAPRREEPGPLPLPGLALGWLVAVSALYLAVRLFGVTLVR